MISCYVMPYHIILYDTYYIMLYVYIYTYYVKCTFSLDNVYLASSDIVPDTIAVRG